MTFTEFIEFSELRLNPKEAWLPRHSVSDNRYIPRCSGKTEFLITGPERLIRTRLIRSSTLFKVSMKCFPIIFLSFHVKNALLIRSST